MIPMGNLVHRDCPDSQGRCYVGDDKECQETQDAWEAYARWLEELDQRTRFEAMDDAKEARNAYAKQDS